MKGVLGHIVSLAIGVLAILIADALLRGDMDRWGDHLERLTGCRLDAVADVLAAVWSGLVLASLTIAVYVAVWFALRLIYNVLAAVPPLFNLLKMGLKMSEFLSKDEARDLIDASDFVRARKPGADKPQDLLGGALTSLQSMRRGPSRREQMIQQGFIRRLVEAFKDQRPDAVTDEGFHRETLEKWLEELFAQDVEQEMGKIPKV